ncbi:hypothetical protein HDV05_008628, partial [Chytridiales sp. JEL 0842]
MDDASHSDNEDDDTSIGFNENANLSKWLQRVNDPNKDPIKDAPLEQDKTSTALVVSTDIKVVDDNTASKDTEALVVEAINRVESGVMTTWSKLGLGLDFQLWVFRLGHMFTSVLLEPHLHMTKLTNAAKATDHPFSSWWKEMHQQNVAVPANLRRILEAGRGLIVAVTQAYNTPLLADFVERNVQLVKKDEYFDACIKYLGDPANKKQSTTSSSVELQSTLRPAERLKITLEFLNVSIRIYERIHEIIKRDHPQWWTKIDNAFGKVAFLSLWSSFCLTDKGT